VIDLRILGPLELVGASGPVELGRGRERALLARLAIANGAVVTVDALVEDLWSGEPPPTAVKALQGHVSRLRRALEQAAPGAGARLVTETAAYALRLDDEMVDARRFERAVAAGRAALLDGDAGRAAASLEGALRLWRARPLADVAYEPFAQAEIARLDEVRIQALEELAEARLALRRHLEAVPDLELLVAEQPFRERPHAQLMLALYRSGRQRDALAVYRETRARLVGELGIEPGRELQELERRILAQDPSLVPGAPEEARPTTQYARSGNVSIAYQVVGDGPHDLVWVRGHVSDLETLWEQPRFVSYVGRLGSHARVVLLEKRGTGMSDRPAHVPTLDERSDDIRAVLDAVDSRRAVLHASYEGCRLAILFAATHPERVEGLVLVDPSARGTRSDEYPWAPDEDEWERTIADVERNWGSDEYLERLIRDANPKASRDPEIVRWFVRLMRRSASPGAAALFNRMVKEGDVTEVLASVHVPTLVLHQPRHAGAARYVGQRIAGARIVELDASDGVYWLDDECVDAWVDETTAFVDSVAGSVEPQRALVVLVAADGEAAGETAAQVVAAHGGRVVDGGPPVLAAFSAATRAVAAAQTLARGPDTRCSVHAGDCELVDGRPTGPAVQETFRLLATVSPGAVARSALVDAIVAATSPLDGTGRDGPEPGPTFETR
jgi:DNA-binding SARP family transcriptional activator